MYGDVCDRSVIHYKLKTWVYVPCELFLLFVVVNVRSIVEKSYESEVKPVGVVCALVKCICGLIQQLSMLWCAVMFANCLFLIGYRVFIHMLLATNTSHNDIHLSAESEQRLGGCQKYNTVYVV